MKSAFKILILSSLVLALGQSPLLASTPDVMELIQKMKNAEEIALKSAQQIEITVMGDNRISSKLIAGKAQKNFQDGKRIIIVILEPESLKGYSYLFKENADFTIDRWIYPPVIGRIRKITSPWNAHESFLDTDFTYADLGFIDVGGDHKLLGETEIEGNAAFELETIPPVEKRYYSKIITFISKDNHLPIRRDFYNRADKIWKRQTFEEVMKVNGVPLPKRIIMTDLQFNRSTELRIKEIRTDLIMPDEIFDPNQIQYALKCPIWERVCRPEEIMKK